LANNLSTDNLSFEKGTAFVIPANQAQYRLIHGIFDKTLIYKDSLFFDITAWTMPLAFGMPYAELNASKFSPSLLGTKVETITNPKGQLLGEKSDYAYLFEWDELLAPKALYELQEAGVLVKVATNKFEIETSNGARKFDYGTISIPVKLQRTDSDKLYELVKATAEKNGLTFYSVKTGNTISGSDLGSSKMPVVTKPTVAMLVGTGVNATDAGEIWHLLDQRMNIPSTHLEQATFNRIDLDKYNTLIMVGGNYGDLNKDKLKTWVQGGGVLIVTEEAVQWAAQNGISSVNFKRAKSPADSAGKLSYVDREQIEGAQQVSGAIFGAEADLTHPLAYGYNQKIISLFKANRVFMEQSKNPFATPFYYGKDPLQSGWVSKENTDAIKNSAAVVVNTVGSGRVISIADNPNFRAFWLGGTKLFMNAIFFGRIIDAASARSEE